MDLVILEKIESSILNGLKYIVRLEKKNGNNGSKYVTVIKPLKTQGLSDFDIANFSKWHCFDTKIEKK